MLKRVAVKLSKTCNDLRLLSSGPRAGLGEINLPAMVRGRASCRARSTGIPEVVNQIAFEVIGNDVTVSFAAEAGQLQLNAFEPIIAHSLFKSINHLHNGCLTLAERCVKGITANRERSRAIVDHSIGIVTALNPYIGYANATQVAGGARDLRVSELVLEKNLLSKERLREILQPGGRRGRDLSSSRGMTARSFDGSVSRVPALGVTAHHFASPRIRRPCRERRQRVFQLPRPPPLVSVATMIAAVAAAIALCAAGPVIAQSAGPALVDQVPERWKKIRDGGVVVIGHRTNSPPFAFLDVNGKPIGYSLDLCEIVVEEIAAELAQDRARRCQVGHAGESLRARQRR